MNNINVLLADDHALVREGLRNSLTKINGIIVVGEVGNGRDLLQAIDTLTPNLLVVDVNMPEFNPISAIRTIRTKYQDLKILVVSAYDDQSQIIGLLSAGINGYHLKDQPLSDFHQAVERILNGGRWISDPLISKLVDQLSDLDKKTIEITLTRRQRELLYYLTLGYNNQKIARVLNISIKTVENHLTNLYRSLNVESRLEASNYGGQHPELLYIPEHDMEQTKHKEKLSESLSVLLVDDNAQYRAQLGKLVCRACPTCSIFEVEDPTDAERIAKQMKIDLAFIDVVLKDDDGIQCLRRIKAISDKTRIILISAYPDWGFRQAGLSAGALAFLDKKDVDAAIVREIINDLFEQ
jgi:DNA-binding NarL/FixJ family response regulator